MTSPKPTTPSYDLSVMGRVFEVLFGCFLAVSLLKFGNPAMFDWMIDWPKDGLQWALTSWPLAIGYWLLVVLALVGLCIVRLRPGTPKWLIAMPLVWLAWQGISATGTVDRELTALTLRYFFACAACFYLGYGCLAGGGRNWSFWLPVLIAMALVIFSGLAQHFGGLAATRHYFYTYLYPQMKNVPPEYLKKMNSTRIFSTLFYPNALAGVLLLLLPPLTVMIWRIGDRMTPAARGLLMAMLWVGGMACLFWSGSKGGWLLQLFVLVVALVHSPAAKTLKLAGIGLLLVAGLVGFGLKYARFFEKGATSVVARFDYWHAALKTVKARPLLGSGPGTFGPVYARIKAPESEMSRLVHNDYLEQASDSGIPGFLAYLALMAGTLWYGYAAPKSPDDWLRFCVWLGVLAWALQGVLEFGLYIPALSWTALGLMGWLVGTSGKRIDKPGQA